MMLSDSFASAIVRNRMRICNFAEADGRYKASDMPYVRRFVPAIWFICELHIQMRLPIMAEGCQQGQQETNIKVKTAH